MPDIDLQVFKEAMADFPAAVTVITTWDDEGHPAGATSPLSPRSASPPMMLACFDRKSKTLECLTRGKPFLIHVLGAGQEHLAMLFAGKSTDKFDGIAWKSGELGLPTPRARRAHWRVKSPMFSRVGITLIVTGCIRHISHNTQQVPLLYHRRKMFAVPQAAAQP
jgi:flavin reductase (DIM6/NTAB) family NADH-FMN oxidoreductase RutF